MHKEIVGKVTEDEKNEMLVIYERRLGLEELTSSLESNLLSDEKKESIQEKIILELGKNKLKSQTWWNKMYERYQWKKIEGCNWHIDFDSCEIFLD